MPGAVGAGLPKKARLRKRPEFIHLSRSGQKQHTTHFLVITRETDRSEARLGITVSSKIGNAVVRNRIKRLLRECFRQWSHQIVPTKDVLIIAKPGAAGLSSMQVASEICQCLTDSRVRKR
jgi:ribonuclease P protein component